MTRLNIVKKAVKEMTLNQLRDRFDVEPEDLDLFSKLDLEDEIKENIEKIVRKYKW